MVHEMVASYFIGRISCGYVVICFDTRHCFGHGTVL